MTHTLATRLQKLEAATKAQTHPPYIAVADASEITPAMLASGVKVYVGISPDDWPDSHTPTP